MAAKKGGLGRGLDALFADNSIEEIASTSAVKLKIMDIEPNRHQPRKIFDEDALAELADSIAKHGVIQPLLVRPMPDGSYQFLFNQTKACGAETTEYRLHNDRRSHSTNDELLRHTLHGNTES